MSQCISPVQVIVIILTVLINVTYLTSQPPSSTFRSFASSIPTPLPHERCFSTDDQTCLLRCHCMNDAACDPLTGACPGDECADGWSGEGCQFTNVALGKPAFQTSYHNIAGDNMPGNCVDGSDSANEGDNTCCSADGDTENEEYWEVDLGGTHVVETVVIKTSQRTNGGGTRNLDVQLYLDDRRVHNYHTDAEAELTKTITLPSNTQADKIRLQKKNPQYRLILCEVSVVGYPYTECEPHQGNYYYGPACIHDCGCEVAEQCDYITGDITCDCKAGYIRSGDKCVSCASSTWGTSCTGRCNCLDNIEKCDRAIGSCLSGCAVWFVGTGCDHELPRLGDAVVPEVTVDGKTITVQLVINKDNRRKRAVTDNVVYKVGYRPFNADDVDHNDITLLTYLEPVWMHGNNGLWIGNVTLPVLRQNYTVCVVPYDLVYAQEGEASACVPVETQCVDGEYGVNDCQYLCTCRDKDEICDKTTGRCTECNDGRVGIDCKLAVPGESDVMVTYLAGVTDIQVTVKTDISNVKNYEVVCIGGINKEEHMGVLHVAQENMVSGVLSNLQGSTEYTCHVIPVLFDDYGKYPCVELYEQVVTTLNETVGNGDSNNSKKSNDSSSNTMPVVAGVLVTVVLVAVVGAIAFIWLRRRSQTDGSAKHKRQVEEKNYMNGNAEKADDKMYENMGAQIDNVEQTPDDDDYQIPRKLVVLSDAKPEKEPTHLILSDRESKPALPAKKPTLRPAKPAASHTDESYLPIKLKDFPQHMAKLNSKEYSLDVEFNSIPQGSASCKAGEKPRNVEKHRFLNIKAYDHSRVKLDVLDGEDEDPDSDYINASYIRDYHGNRTVIASQAPRVPTVDDMWRMIWQEDVNQIVMLTKLKEVDKIKCQRYWPAEGEQDYAGITVELLSSTSNSFYTERRIRVAKGEETRMITHVQYTNWPDHGVPDCAHEVLYVYYKVKSLEQSRTGRLLVHCSAGVGRTGTFVGLEWLLEQSRNEKRVDVERCVRSMREDRTQMVQNIHQYRFLYQLLHEALTIGNTTITTNNYKSFMDATSYDDVTSNQMSQINQIYMPNVAAADCSAALTHENINKTRGGADNAPANTKRLFLSTPVPGHTDYINAVRCHSFNNKHDIIMTQLPLPDTVPDIWRLVYDHSVSGIVLLDDIPSDEVPYWPTSDETEMSFGPLSVKLVKESSKMYDDLTVRDFTVEHKGNPGDARKVRQWHLTSWGESGASVSPTVLTVLVDLSTQHTNKMATGTTMVQCLDGVNRCGLYVAYNNLLEMMIATKTIDVCFAIRQVRSVRPQAIRSVEQLQLLYRWMDDALSDTQEYYN